jgi:hypothetical protein
VRDPARQQLPQRHRSQLGMLAEERQLRVRQPPLLQRLQVGGAQLPEFIEQIPQ